MELKLHPEFYKTMVKTGSRSVFVIILLATMFDQNLINTASSAEIYKWIDEKGNIHYGDKPAVDSAEKIDVTDTARPDPIYRKELKQQTKLLDVMRGERLENERNRDRIRAERAKRKTNCLKARNLLADMQNASYLYEATEDPFNPRVLSSEERASETAKMESEVKRWCD